ncbi:MAG: translation factor GTPase family protein [Candidatus Saccharimonas sp.]
MKILNLGVLAHVDAGKTSLTERLLFNNGVIKTLGSVDKGNTQTDSMAIERQRGITIKSAVTSFILDDLKINILDTPGHPDFIAEVERVLSVLDGVILVISAVEGVQAQTRILMRALQRLHVPTIIFVNKIDRMGAKYDELLQDISDKLALDAIAMGTVKNIGTKEAAFKTDDLKSIKGVPVFFGSAITNAGIELLTAGIKELLRPAKNISIGPVSGTVFKVERGTSGDKIAYVRMFSGAIYARDQFEFGKVTAVSIFSDGAIVPAKSVSAGDIAKLWGLAGIKIGDTIGVASDFAVNYHFAPPTLETVIKSVDESKKGALRVALDQLAEQDPLINLRQDDMRQEISVSLYGEVQKEVIQDTLVNEYGIDAVFQETTTICIERLVGSGSAVEFQPTSRVGEPELNKKVNQFLATVGLRVEPGLPNTGVTFRVGNEATGRMPSAFYKAVEEAAIETLGQGIYGWQVTDCVITMTNAGYWPRQSSAHGGFDKNMSSTARDFRQLTPLVVMDALKDAGVIVCEPVHSFTLEVPEETLGTIIAVLAQFHATASEMTTHERVYVLEGEIPVNFVHNLQQQLPGLSSGEGVLETTFSNYRPVVGQPPIRSRTDYNPLNRKEYLLHVLKKG